MAFINVYVRHSAETLDRVRFPGHALSSPPSLVVPVVRQELKKPVSPK